MYVLRKIKTGALQMLGFTFVSAISTELSGSVKDCQPCNDFDEVIISVLNKEAHNNAKQSSFPEEFDKVAEAAKTVKNLKPGKISIAKYFPSNRYGIYQVLL